MTNLEGQNRGELWRWRVPVVFEVNALAWADARRMVDTALTDASVLGAPGQGSATAAARQDAEGLVSWTHQRDVFPTAEVPRSLHRTFLADLGTVELLRAFAEAQGEQPEDRRLLTADELFGLQVTLAAADRYVEVPDPEHPDLDPMFTGHASEALDTIPDGLYDATDLAGREVLLTVGPSRFAPGGRAAASFPPSTADSHILGEVSRVLQGFDRTQQPAAVLERISNLVKQTAWEGANSGELLAARNTITRPPLVDIAVITWSDDPDVEPTVIAGRHPVAVTRSAAVMIAEELSHSEAFAGGTAFLENHTDPADWRLPEDVDDWLEALQNSTPLPRVTFVQLPVTGGGDGYNRPLADALARRAEQLNGDNRAPEPPTSSRARHL